MVPAAEIAPPFEDFGHVVDIFDEVNEDVRRERMQALAKRYGPWGTGAVVLIIGAVAAVTFWNQRQETKTREAGASFLAAARAQQTDPGGASATYGDLAATGPAGYALLARFKYAETLADKGDRKGAIDALNGAEQAEGPERYKELARLMALNLRSYDESPESLLPLVEPLAAAGRPWRLLAMEQAAMLEWKLGKLAEARKRLETISADLEAPAGLRARAEAALTALPEG